MMRSLFAYLALPWRLASVSIFGLALSVAATAWAAGAPASMTLSPSSAEIVAGDTRTFTATLLDSAGEETVVEANSQVGFAIDVSSVAAVTPNADDSMSGDVLGRRPGATPLRAFYVRDGAQTSIVAASNVTVVAAGTGEGGSGPSACTDTLCGTNCVDLAVDALNCGSCDYRCTSRQTCTDGLCAANCGAGTVACGSVCIDTETDSANCGACGRACAAGNVCVDGGCVVHRSCPDEDDCNGVCTDKSEDPANCGDCGNVCTGGTVCSNGTCEAGCDANAPLPETACGEICSNLLNQRNCGACGVVCAANERCRVPFAEDVADCVVCGPGQALCGNSCASLNDTFKHCGSCENACVSGEGCYDGRCAPSTRAADDYGDCSLSPGMPAGGLPLDAGVALAFGGLAALIIRRRQR